MEKQHGFVLKREREIKDVSGVLQEYVHEKTGCELCFLKRDDSNKTFMIGFKTLPSDDTGVFHILEHSVLNGSKKYPVKEPFVELLKGSMQTFLNAFTAPDKTMYPVSSRNDKDFMNLMSVYLDAVFQPLIYTNPNIFYQEGWHYEVQDVDSNPTYNGVVYNEMKGAYSSVDETLIGKLNQGLFPDNCYQYESGGEPSAITDLTYEQFIETHKKFYHPTNAKIFLDGDIHNLEEILIYIDKEYLSHYEKEEITFEIVPQKKITAKTIEYEYELAPNEEENNRTQIAFAKVISNYDEVEKNIAWQLLCSILVSNNESKLKKSILLEGLAEDVELDFMDSNLQPWVVLTLRNTNAENYDRVKEILVNTSKEIIEEGIEVATIQAALNQLEFRYREKKELAGLSYGQLMMKSWGYDGDPALYLERLAIYDDLKKKAEEGYFEELFKEFLLEEDGLLSVIAKPSKTLAEERLKKEEEKLKAAKESWEDVNAYVEKTKELLRWQMQEDSKEALATLPKLTLEDIEENPEDYPWQEKNVLGANVLEYPKDDAEIVYLTCYFNLAGITVDDLPKVGLYASMLGRLPTKRKSVEELQREIRAYTGGITFGLEAYGKVGQKKACKPLIAAHVSTQKKDLDIAIDLVREILLETKYEKETILPILRQENEEYRQALVSMGHSMALTHTLAKYSADAVFREYVSGFASGNYSLALEKDYDNQIDEFMNLCQMMQEIIYSPYRLTASINEDAHCLENFISTLPKVEAQRASVHYPLLKEGNEKVVIPGSVAYVATGNNLEKEGLEFNGYLSVLGHMLSFDYLWSEVREKGGAYGTGMIFGLGGNVASYSYRDPNPLHTIEATYSLANYFDNFEDDYDMTNFIIGTMAALEPLSTQENKMRTADTRYFREITYDMRKKNRKEALTATMKKLKEYQEVLEKIMKGSSVTVVGSKDLVDALDFDELA